MTTRFQGFRARQTRAGKNKYESSDKGDLSGKLNSSELVQQQITAYKHVIAKKTAVIDEVKIKPISL